MAIPYTPNSNRFTFPNDSKQSANSKVNSKTPLTREEEIELLKRVQGLAKLLDNCFVIPGTTYRIGWDSLIGLIPGFGDVATAGMSLYLVHVARQLDMPNHVVRKMLINIAIDATGGLVPIIGDVFDMTWKANLKNAKILEHHLLKRHASTVFEVQAESDTL